MKINNSAFYPYKKELNEDIFDFLYKTELNPEQALWRAIILQAFIDLKNNSRKKITKTHKLKSALWFNMKNEEFILTCDYADLNASFVHKFAEKIKDDFYENKALAPII